jgi:uncharacterized protein (DUF1697 family)
MIGYIAFLRGINVSGQKIIKMEDLKKMLLSFGLKNVKTYIQSGNFVFESSEADVGKLIKKIGKGLLTEMGYEVPVILRTLAEMQALILSDPFKLYKPSEDEKWYVTFMAESPAQKPKLPVFSKKEDVEVFQISHHNACCISHKKNGSFGFPNLIIEKEFNVTATTRNWNTVCKITALAEIGIRKPDSL